MALERLALKPGFWRPHARSLDIRPCYRVGACKGGDSVTTPPGSNESYCATGYGGVLCDVCEPGYVVTAEESCVLCQGGSGSLWGPGIVLLVVVLVLGVSTTAAICKHKAGAVLWKSDKAASVSKSIDQAWSKWSARFARLSYFSVKLKILLSLFQVVTTLNIVYDVPRFPFYFSLLKYLAIFNLDFVRIVPLGCVVRLNFHSTLLM